MLNNRTPRERLALARRQVSTLGTANEDIAEQAAVRTILTEHHEELRELRTTVTEHARALAGGVVAQAEGCAREIEHLNALVETNTETIAQLTRERDEVRRERDHLQNLGKVMSECADREREDKEAAIADRDQLKAELEVAKRDAENWRTASLTWEQNFNEVQAKHLASLRAQSSDGLREAVEALRLSWLHRFNNEKSERETFYHSCSRELGAVLAAHPAPSPDSPADGDRVAPSGGCEHGHGMHEDCGDCISRVTGIDLRKTRADVPLTIGAHTMTVAEWEGLAESLVVSRERERVSDEALAYTSDQLSALRARIEKAVDWMGRLIGDGSWPAYRNAYVSELRELVTLLTSDQPMAPSGDGFLSEGQPDNAHELRDYVSPTEIALRARIEKAVAKVDHALQWDMSNHPRNVFREVREILTSDQPPGEGKLEREERAPVSHQLKTWPAYFAEVRSGAKTWEFRKDDRDYRVGDELLLREWDPETREYTGSVEVRRVAYVARGTLIPAGLCVMSLALPVATPDLVERVCWRLQGESDACLRNERSMGKRDAYANAIRIVREEAGRK